MRIWSYRGKGTWPRSQTLLNCASCVQVVPGEGHPVRGLSLYASTLICARSDSLSLDIFNFILKNKIIQNKNSLPQSHKEAHPHGSPNQLANHPVWGPWSKRFQLPRRHTQILAGAWEHHWSSCPDKRSTICDVQKYRFTSISSGAPILLS